MTDRVRIAVSQLHIEPWQQERNRAKILEQMRQASAYGARLVVFSEAMSGGYVFHDVDEARAAATTIPGPFIDPILARAAELGLWVAIGVLERAPDGIFNDALLVSPAGHVHATYRKTFFIRSDKIWMRHGGVAYRAYETPVGRLGMVICADMRIPEPARCTALAGAQVILNLANWGGPDQYEIHAPARSLENHCWMACADKVGAEPGIRYPGHSMVLDPDGCVVAEASEFEEELLLADIDPAAADQGPHQERFRGRRPELYTELSELQALPESPPIQVEGRFVAACQVPAANVEAALQVCEEAFRLDEADLLVLPELCTVTDPTDAAEVRRRAAETPRVLERFCAFSATTGSTLVVGLPAERDGGRLTNSAFVIDGGQVVTRYDKTHVEPHESQWCTPGDTLATVVTRAGVIGVLLGCEGLLPEVPRLLARRGAEILAWPCCWRSERASRVIPLERALENQVYVVAANRTEAGVGFSQVCAPRSYPTPAARAAFGPGRIGAVGQLVVPEAARVKLLSRNTDVFAHRRPEAYGVLSAGVQPRDGREVFR